MRVTIRLGEPFWRTLGERQIIVALVPDATVAQAITVLLWRCPALAAELTGAETRPALFVDDDAAQPDSPLADGATLHILWPASGG